MTNAERKKFCRVLQKSDQWQRAMRNTSPHGMHTMILANLDAFAPDNISTAQWIRNYSSETPILTIKAMQSMRKSSK